MFIKFVKLEDYNPIYINEENIESIFTGNNHWVTITLKSGKSWEVVESLRVVLQRIHRTHIAHLQEIRLLNTPVTKEEMDADKEEEPEPSEEEEDEEDEYFIPKDKPFCDICPYNPKFFNKE